MSTRDDSDAITFGENGNWIEEIAARASSGSRERRGAGHARPRARVTPRDWATVSVGSAALIGVMLAADVPNAVLAPAFLWLLLACPGLAWVPAFGVRPLWAEVIAVVVASVAIEIVVAALLILAGVGTSLSSVFVAASLVCVAGWCVQALPEGSIDAPPRGHHEGASLAVAPAVESMVVESDSAAGDWFEQTAVRRQPGEYAGGQADAVERTGSQS